MPAIVLIKKATNNVPDSPGKWLAGEVVGSFETTHEFSHIEVAGAGNFLHLTVSDRTVEQVQTYLESWDHSTATVTQIAATGDDRTIRIETTMVSVSGDGAFSDPANMGDGSTTFGDPAPGFDTFLADINADYPTANATYNDHTWTIYDFDITAPEAAKDEIVQRALETVQGIQVHRRRWYMPQASRTLLEGQGDQGTFTAAQIASGNHLRDGLLD